MEAKILNYAKLYLEGKIVMIEQDLDSGLYGDKPTKELKKKLYEYTNELQIVEDKISK